MSDLAWNVWDTVAAALGILIPIGAAWFIASLPTSRLPSLLSLMKETQELFAVALREGLITDEKEFFELKVNIVGASIRVDEVRAKVYATQSVSENIANWYNGLSNKISLIYVDVNRTRVRLVKNNSNERKKLASEGLSIDIPSPTNMEDPHSVIPPPTSIPARSTSYPPLGSPATRDASSHCLACGALNPTSAVHPRSHSDHYAPSEVSAAESRGVDIAEPNPLPNGPQHSSARPTHHLVSDAELQSLLSLAICHPLLWAEGDKHERARQSRILLDLGTQLYGTALSPPTSITPRTKRHAKRTRFKTLSRLLRRVYGVRLPYNGSDANVATLDPESLLPLRAEY